MFSFSTIFRYLWLLVRRYKLALFALLLTVIVRMSSIILVPYAYKNVIDILSLDNIDSKTRAEAASYFIFPILFVYIFSVLSSRYREFVNYRFASSMIKDIYDFSFKRLTLHSYKFFTDNFAGSLVAKVRRFVRAFEVINYTVIQNFWYLILLVLSSTVMLYFQSKILALVLISWSLLYALMVFIFVRQKIKLDLKEAEADSRISGVLADSLTNILNIKIFSAFKKEFNYFQEFSTALKQRIHDVLRFSMFQQGFQAGWMVFFQVFLLGTMIWLWERGEVSLGLLMMAYAYAFTILDRMWELGEATTSFMKAMTDIKEVVDIFETELEVEDIKNPEVCRMKNGEIEFKNVHFYYVEENIVFDNFALKLKKGEKIGLVGHSGSGKSTIVKLLLRFMDVGRGEILIDGQNIAKITQEDLRRVISYVPQEPILFHRSIRDNIAYSRPEAIEEQIIDSAKKAHAHEFILNLKYGYDTLVGERGVKLSGGERQRVAIARAMLKDSPILMLDEATSSLDSISESYIQDAFSELMKGKTTLVIAHRLSTVQKMDRIIVLDKGKIAEEGTHRELLEKNGLYADLWEHQTGGFL